MKRTSMMIVSLMLATAAMAQPQGQALKELRQAQSGFGMELPAAPPIGGERIVGPRMFTGLPIAPTPNNGGLLQQLSNEFSGLYQKTSPSVVMIILSGDDDVTRRIAHRQLDEQLDKQGAQTVGDMHPSAGKADEQKIATGSGFVIDPKGLIITNDHVVEFVDEGAKVTIKFSDGTLVPGKVLQKSKGKDLALVQAEVRRPVAALPMADSDRVQVGEVVCALGNPLGIESVFTCGTVTGINNELGKIQTDAAINHGNSGGPLLNARGEVVGVVQMVLADENGAINPGMGFAIPINQVKKGFAK